MFFKDINSIKTKADKSFQLELVSIYCKIVRQLTCKLAIPFTLESKISKKIINELLDIGIISSKLQIPDLEKQLVFCIMSLYLLLQYTWRINVLLGIH